MKERQWEKSDESDDGQNDTNKKSSHSGGIFYATIGVTSTHW